MKRLIVLHGWTYSTDKWQPLVKYLKEKNIEVAFLSVPGLTEETAKVWTLEDYVEWLKDKLASEKQPILIGHSNGGRIAIAFASKYPDKLKRLILIDSAGIFHNKLPLKLKRFIFGTLARFGKKVTSSKKLRNLLYKAARESDYKDAAPPMRQTMVNLISSDLTPQLGQITVPTLIIWGKLDRVTPLSDGFLMHRLIKKSKLQIIDGAGHSPYFTHAALIRQKILEEI